MLPALLASVLLLIALLLLLRRKRGADEIALPRFVNYTDLKWVRLRQQLVFDKTNRAKVAALETIATKDV
eukprot:m.65349 g.65349  ORF g.65349 m.65349 type:complete len:70 (-) comp49788_c0_seq3:1416-1625(-)